MPMAAPSSSSDPNQWVQHPPRTFVKIVETTRADLNGQVGLVVGYTDGRYQIYLGSPNQLSLRPSNLQKASYLQQIKAQYNLLFLSNNNNAQLRQQIERYIASVERTTGLSRKTLAVLIVLVAMALVRWIGLRKLILLISFGILWVMVVPMSLLVQHPKQALQQIPERWQRLLLIQSFPGSQIVANNRYLLYGSMILVMWIFVSGMIQ